MVMPACFSEDDVTMGLLKIEYKGNLLQERPEVILPGSKSMAARALIINFIRGESQIPINLPDCDDTRELYAALSALSKSVILEKVILENNSVRRFYKCKEGMKLSLNLGNGATSYRFFLSLVASIPGLEVKLDCGESLRRRPLSPLIDFLRKLGADIEYLGEEGYPPLCVKGANLSGGDIVMDGSVSSQFVSSLILSSELWQKPCGRIEILGDKVSYPYIEMTRRMISPRGAEMLKSIEADWSAASYFYEYALVCPEIEVHVSNLTQPEESVQGDARCAEIYSQLGVETEYLSDGSAIIRGDGKRISELRKSGKEVELSLGNLPDLVPSLVVGMAVAGIRFKIYGIGHLRHKESNRLLSLQEEIGRIGYRLTIDNESISWNGDCLPMENLPVIESHSDHRIVMAMAIAASSLNGVGLIIRGAESVTKSFPGFFGEIAKLGFVNFEK